MAALYGCSSVCSRNFLTFGLLLLTIARFSHQSMLVVNRRSDGDQIDVKETILCRNFVCEKYKADMTASGLGSSCMCKCAGRILQPTTTFYGKESKCMENSAIAKDNSCSVTARDGLLKSLSLLVLDPNMTKPKEVLLENIPRQCKEIKISWFYYKDKAWTPGSQNIFSVTSKTKSILGGERKWFLKISNEIPKEINGLLIKVGLQYVYDDGFNPNHCIMFKVLGSYKVIPTTLPPSTAPTTTMATTTVMTSTANPSTVNPSTVNPSTSSIPSKGPSQTSTEQIPNPIPTIAPTSPSTTATQLKPKKEPSKEMDQRLLIAFATGGVTLLIVLVIACIGICIYVRRQRRKKAKKDSIVKACTRPSVPPPPTSPPHDYEYVVYPEMEQNIPAKNSLDNAMYGRGPDNELVIRTPGISMESLTSKHNSTKSNQSTASIPLMAHDYTHLGKDNLDQNNSIYQPLIRPHTPSDTNYIDKSHSFPRPSTSNDVNGFEKPQSFPRSRAGCDVNESRPLAEYAQQCNQESVPEYMELEPIQKTETTV